MTPTETRTAMLSRIDRALTTVKSRNLIPSNEMQDLLLDLRLQAAALPVPEAGGSIYNGQRFASNEELAEQLLKDVWPEADIPTIMSNLKGNTQ